MWVGANICSTNTYCLHINRYYRHITEPASLNLDFPVRFVLQKCSCPSFQFCTEMFKQSRAMFLPQCVINWNAIASCGGMHTIGYMYIGSPCTVILREGGGTDPATVDFHSLRIVRFRIPAPAVVTDSPLTFNSRRQIQKVS